MGSETASGKSGSVSGTIVINAPPCTTGTPTVTLSPSTQQSILAGGTANYTVSVANTDSASCVAAAFSLQPTVASGWSASFPSGASLTIGPGSTGTAPMNVTA